MAREVNLRGTVGKGYRKFWEFKGRYRVVKGGRGSKKSVTACLWLVFNMMLYSSQYGVLPNALVIRRFANTHRDSTFAQLRWAISRLNVDHLWHCTVSPMEMTFKSTGQKIMFRGMDNPESITSITVTNGHLCWTLWEEGYQIENEEAFNKVDLSIRGELPFPLFKQHTIIMNPWSEKTWIKKRFFDQVDPETGLSEDGNILAITKNYDVNEFLGADDIELFEYMKQKYPRRYNVEGLGNWGIAEGLIFENAVVADFDPNAIYNKKDVRGRRLRQLKLGLDFGFTNDPTAFVGLLVDEKSYEIWIFAEVYRTRMSNKDIYNSIHKLGFANEMIWADSADARTINELKMLGLGGLRGVSKDTVVSGIQVLQDYRIYIHPTCENILVEKENYVWELDKFGKPTNNPVDDFNHGWDAVRYATCQLQRRTFSWANER